MGNFESHEWTSPQYQPSGPNAMSNGLNGVEDSSAGVYWFWNTMWDESRKELKDLPRLDPR